MKDLRHPSVITLVLLATSCGQHREPTKPISGSVKIELRLPTGIVSLSDQTPAFDETTALQTKATHRGIPQFEVIKRQGTSTTPKPYETQPNYKYMTLASPNDALYQSTTSQQWIMNAMGMPAAWESTFNATEVKVAVLDDGFFIHEELPASVFDVDPVGCNQTTGQFCLNPAMKNDDPFIHPGMSMLKHGLQVSGIIAATTNNALGLASPNWLGGQKRPIRIVPIRIFNDNNEAYSSTLAHGIETAIKKKVKVINLSLCLKNTSGVCENIYSDPLIDKMLQLARSQGIVVVAASGNFAQLVGRPAVAYPANHPGVVAVGAVNALFQRGDFSQYGGPLRFVAPGVGIPLLSITLNQENFVSEYNFNLESNKGTSYSTPLVAAATALLFSKKPEATWEQVMAALYHSGENLSDPTLINAKRINVGKALTLIDTNTLPLPPLRGAYKASLLLSPTWVKTKDFEFNSNSTIIYDGKDIQGGDFQISARVENIYNKTQYQCNQTIKVNPDIDNHFVVDCTNPTN